MLSWCDKNGQLGSSIKNHWTGILADNDNKDDRVKISEVSYSSNKKYIWICEKGHKYIQSINSKTNMKCGCTYCQTHNTSYFEQYIYFSFKQIFRNTQNRVRVLKNKYNNGYGLEFDIGIPEIRTCIEYSPNIWHKDRLDIYYLKNKVCEEKNVRLINIIDEYGCCIEELHSNTYENIFINTKGKSSLEQINSVINNILLSVGHSIDEIDTSEAEKNAWDYSKGKIEYSKTLEYTNDAILKEWNYQLNNIRPSEIKPYSHQEIYWTCTKCGYGSNGEWKNVLSSRVKGKTGCPNCGYNIYENRYKIVKFKYN